VRPSASDSRLILINLTVLATALYFFALIFVLSINFPNYISTALSFPPLPYFSRSNFISNRLNSISVGIKGEVVGGVRDTGRLGVLSHISRYMYSHVYSPKG